ncbi:MAG: alpha/beta fold hydrolase [Polyangiaceae bacterium]
MTIASKKITFPSAQGHSLAARLELPEGQPRAFALFAHCFTCSKDSTAASRISRALADEGFAVLRFDFTGLGGSEGDFANTDFSSNLSDLVAAADYLRAEYQAPTVLVGHSLGGAAVLRAAARIEETRAVVTLNAPFDPAHVKELLSAAEPALLAAEEAEVNLAGRTFRVKRSLLDDLSDQPMREAIGNLGAALLVMHSPTDDVVGVDNARLIFEAARHPKSFVSLDGASHLLGQRADAIFAARVIAAWAARYLAAEKEPKPDDERDHSVVVAETHEGRYTQSVAFGNHRMRADEPVALGGLDSGPSPYDLLLASLGACTSMTLRMYAEHKQLPLDGVRVTLEHRKIYAKDCGDCETKQGKIDHIDRVIEVEGDLSDEQRQRLLEIADKCPVHRTLHAEVKIASQLKR